jgi:hypothetical protein
MVRRRRVKSSSIRAVGYARDAKELWVEYRGAPGTYRCPDVPHSAFLELEKAESKGGYVNRMIKGRFSYEYHPRPSLCAPRLRPPAPRARLMRSA